MAAYIQPRAKPEDRICTASTPPLEKWPLTPDHPKPAPIHPYWAQREQALAAHTHRAPRLRSVPGGYSVENETHAREKEVMNVLNGSHDQWHAVRDLAATSSLRTRPENPVSAIRAAVSLLVMDESPSQPIANEALAESVKAILGQHQGACRYSDRDYFHQSYGSGRS